MLGSILTNVGAMDALQSLQATETSLTNTQNQISTGLRVQTAKDDASAWTIATTMKSNVASLNQVSTDLGNADSILGTSVSGATQVSSLVTSIRAKVASVTDPSQNTTAIQDEVNQLVSQIGAVIGSSSFNGVNLLNTTGAGQNFLAATNNDYTAAGQANSTMIATGGTVDLSSANTATAAVSNFYAMIQGTAAAGTPGNGLSAIVAGTYNGATSQTQALDNALNTIDAFSNQVESQAAQFGAVQQSVEGQQTFVNSLSTALTAGVSNMVDANMTTESAQLSALQTQQQLGTQALSIANQSPQLLLKLFP